MLQMNAAKVPAAEEERLARDPGFDRFVEPERSAADRPAQFRIEFGRVEEPEVGVGLAGLVEWAFERAFVEELALCRVVAAADDFAAPEAEVADHFQVRGTGADPEGFLRAEIGREVPELAVHRHEEIVGVAHFADARPLRIPAVRAVVAVRRFGEAVLEPLPAVQDHQDERAEIPPDRPERLAAFFLVEAENAARAGHFGELVAQNDLPVFALSVPLAEGAGGDFGTAKGFGGTLPVIRVHVAALGGVKPFSVVAGQNVAVRRVRFVRVAEKLLHLERFHVDLVEALLHRHAGDFIGRVGQVPGVSRVPAGHFLVVDHPDVSLRVDHVRADEELVRFFVDHPVRGRAADGFRPVNFVQIFVQLVKPVGGPRRGVRSVRHKPELPGPRHDRAGSALALTVEIGQMRVNTTEGRVIDPRRGGGFLAVGRVHRKNEQDQGTGGGFTEIAPGQNDGRGF